MRIAIVGAGGAGGYFGRRRREMPRAAVCTARCDASRVDARVGAVTDTAEVAANCSGNSVTQAPARKSVHATSPSFVDAKSNSSIRSTANKCPRSGHAVGGQAGPYRLRTVVLDRTT
jgi:hypothetical protein